MAANPSYTPLLLGLGVRSFSTNAAAVPRVKQAVRSTTLDDCQRLAWQVMKQSDPMLARALARPIRPVIRNKCHSKEIAMLKFYYSLAPNPMKVALFLEEAGLEYEAIPVDTRKGEQFEPDFAALNPNNKVPVIVDGETTVFDSNAILLYLAEKTGRFIPTASQHIVASCYRG